MVQPPRCDVLPPRRCSEKGSREIGSRPTDCGIGQLSLTFALLRGGVGRSPLSLPLFFSFRVFLYIIPSCNFSPFIFQRPLFCTLSSLFFFLFFPFSFRHCSLSLLHRSLFIDIPIPQVLLPVSSLLSFFSFLSFFVHDLSLSLFLSFVPAMGTTSSQWRKWVDRIDK